LEDIIMTRTACLTGWMLGGAAAILLATPTTAAATRPPPDPPLPAQTVQVVKIPVPVNDTRTEAIHLVIAAAAGAALAATAITRRRRHDDIVVGTDARTIDLTSTVTR
jgi:hypothetical protein